MSLYRVSPEKLEPVESTTFASEHLKEREHIQKMLKEDMSPLGEDMLVIAEEYSEWEDSRRRIDLLCLDHDGNLVVVELKRTENGGHMELQALRYAAMVSNMTMEQVAAAYARSQGSDIEEAMKTVSGFLQSESDDDAELSGKIRILLVSADFSTEMTTAVLWLNSQGLDITCFKIRPYRSNGEVLVSIDQIIPLPEAADYEVKLRAKENERHEEQALRHVMRKKFWTQYLERARARTSLLANRTPSIHGNLGIRLKKGFHLYSAITAEQSRISCYINIVGKEQKTLGVFRELERRKERIEKELVLNQPLIWEAKEGKKGCRIYAPVPGGWSSPEKDWPVIQKAMIDTLIQIDEVFRKEIDDIDLDAIAMHELGYSSPP